MKCTPIKLLSRTECTRKTEMKRQNVDQIFITKESNGYTVSFTKNLLQKPNKTTSLSIKTMSLPDGLQSYNGGYSLEKWSKKRPRLRSGKHEQKYTEYDYDNTCDVMEFIDSLDDTEDNSELQLDDPSQVDDDYEISSDIEELIRNSRSSESNTSLEAEQQKGKTRKKKKKSRKTIRFSFSKPVSPETEQIIRVDVTSNISMDDLKQAEVFNGHNMNTSRRECARAIDNKGLSIPYLNLSSKVRLS